jgi:hypothetical protein
MAFATPETTAMTGAKQDATVDVTSTLTDFSIDP